MSADFCTSINMKGTETELLSLLKIVRMYASEKREQYRTKGDCAYLVSAYIGDIGGKEVQNLSDDELLEVIKESGGQINLEASGPYGRFLLLNEVELFEEMADAAPTAWFEGLMDGFNAGGDQAVKGDLEDGMLKLSYRYPADDMWEEEYDGDDEDEDDEDNEADEWDEEALYISIPSVSDASLYVAEKINKEKPNVVFEKHNFAVSDSCSDKNAVVQAIERRGGKIKKSVGKTTHYLIIGKNINGYDKMAIKAITINAEENKNIEAVTEEQLLAMIQ